jgi:CheY-like chemotaxis protein
MVQGIAHTHGCAMKVRSRPDAGTTFDLYFPTISQPDSAPATRLAAPAGNREEILVVDDEQSVGTFVATRLQQFNYSVTVFDDPRDALEASENGIRRFDAIVTDLTMPHISGMELIQKLRKNRPTLPAVVISGYNKNVASTKLAAMPQVAVLLKPFTGDYLALALGQLLGQKQPVG